MFALASLFVAVAVVFVFFRLGDQFSPEVIFLLGWIGGLSLAASVGLTVRWLLHGGWRRSRPDRYEASVPHPYERRRSF